MIKPELIDPENIHSGDPLDPDSPLSLLNLVSPALRDAFEKVPQEFMVMDSVKLFNHCKPTAVDARLRSGLWAEYLRCKERGGEIKISDIYAGVCTRAYFYHLLTNQKQKLAWILCPPEGYMQTMEACMNMGLMRIHEIMNLPVIHPRTGKPDPKVAELILKATIALDMRLERERDAVNAKKPKQIEPPATPATGPSVEEMEAEILRLEAQSAPTDATAKVPELMDSIAQSTKGSSSTSHKDMEILEASLED